MTDSISNEIAHIESKMGTQEYIRDESMQARLRDLYSARDTGAAPAPAQVPGEKAEIERVMREDRKRYDRDEAMQQRYRELLDGERAPDPAPVTGDGGFVPARSMKEWGKAGGDPAEFGQYSELAQRSNDLLWDMPTGAREQFGASFARLPEAARSLAFGALMDRSAVSPFPLSDDALSELRQVPAYAELMQEWGREAPHKLATAQERLWRVLDRLNDTDAHAVMRWLDGLPRAAMQALTRRLAG